MSDSTWMAGAAPETGLPSSHDDAAPPENGFVRRTSWSLLTAVLVVAAYSWLTADVTRAAARVAAQDESAAVQDMAGSFSVFFTFVFNIGTVLILALLVRVVVAAVGRGARWKEHRRRLVGGVAQLVLHVSVIVFVVVRLIVG